MGKDNTRLSIKRLFKAVHESEPSESKRIEILSGIIANALHSEVYAKTSFEGLNKFDLPKSQKITDELRLLASKIGDFQKNCDRDSPAFVTFCGIGIEVLLAATKLKLLQELKK